VPQREDSNRIPGIEKNDAEAGKVLYVARHESEVVFKGGGGNHSVGGAEGSPGHLAHAVESAPSDRNRLGYR